MTAKVQGSSDSRSTQNNSEMSVTLDKAAVKSMKALGVAPQQIQTAVRAQIEKLQLAGKGYTGNALEISVRVGNQNIALVVFVDTTKDAAKNVKSCKISDVQQIPTAVKTAETNTANSIEKMIKNFMSSAAQMDPAKFLKSIEAVRNGDDAGDIAGTSANGYSPAFFTRIQEVLLDYKNIAIVGNLPEGILQVIRDCPTIGNPPVINMVELKKGILGLANKKSNTVVATNIVLASKPVERKSVPTPTTTTAPQRPAQK
jgi:hypothetical protein